MNATGPIRFDSNTAREILNRLSPTTKEVLDLDVQEVAADLKAAVVMGTTDLLVDLCAAQAQGHPDAEYAVDEYARELGRELGLVKKAREKVKINMGMKRKPLGEEVVDVIRQCLCAVQMPTGVSDSAWIEDRARNTAAVLLSSFDVTAVIR